MIHRQGSWEQFASFIRWSHPPRRRRAGGDAAPAAPGGLAQWAKALYRVLSSLRPYRRNGDHSAFCL